MKDWERLGQILVDQRIFASKLPEEREGERRPASTDRPMSTGPDF